MFNKKQSSLLLKKRLLNSLQSILMSTTFMLNSKHGNIIIRPSIILWVSMPKMKMVMEYMKCHRAANRCNTQECIWSLLRPWLRPHRGVSQEKLPFYVGYFEFLHNLRKRGKKALQETFELLLKLDLRNYQQCLIISPI